MLASQALPAQVWTGWITEGTYPPRPFNWTTDLEVAREFLDLGHWQAHQVTAWYGPVLPDQAHGLGTDGEPIRYLPRQVIYTGSLSEAQTVVDDWNRLGLLPNATGVRFSYRIEDPE